VSLCQRPEGRSGQMDHGDPLLSQSTGLSFRRTEPPNAHGHPSLPHKGTATVGRLRPVNRKVYPQVPPKVEYSLTPLGQEFIPVLKALEKFSTTYQGQV